MNLEELVELQEAQTDLSNLFIASCVLLAWWKKKTDFNEIKHALGDNFAKDIEDVENMCVNLGLEIINRGFKNHNIR